jgi:PilZ domain
LSGTLILLKFWVISLENFSGLPLSKTMIFHLNLQNSYDKVKFLTLIQFLVVFIAFMSEALVTGSVVYISFLFEFLLLIFTFNFYYKALTHLFYSYWNISFILATYYLISMTRNVFVLDHGFIGFLYFLSFIFLGIACYIISSPVYFPRVHWWEYDFRFRSDLRCYAEVDGRQYRGRLSDLRRGAACLELFCHTHVGQHIQLNLEILNQNFTLFAEVKSKREPIMGRSIIYGIKFLNVDLEQRQRLKLLSNYWKESKKIKIRNKFAALK